MITDAADGDTDLIMITVPYRIGGCDREIRKKGASIPYCTVYIQDFEQAVTI